MADAKVEIQISAKDAASAVFNKVGSSAAALGKTLAVGIAAGGAAVAAGIGASIKVAADFEKQMSAVQAVSKASAAEMAQLGDKALQLGKDTTFSATQAASGLEELVKGGVPIADIMNGAAEATLALAEAGGVDLRTAAEVATAAINTFNLSGEDMGHVADLVAGAANNSAIDVNDFRLSTAAAGAAVALAGGSFDDMAVAITAMGNAGIKGSDAGTSLKTMLMNLQPQTEKQKQLFNELGLVTANGANKFFDAQGKVKDFAEVAGVLQTALAGQTDQQKLTTLETIFGSDAIRAAAVFANEGSEGFNRLSEAIGREGSAAEAGRIRTDNLAGDMERLGGSVETAAIKFGTAFGPAARAAAQAFSQFIDETVIPLAEELGPPLADAAVRAGNELGKIGNNAKDAAQEGLQAFRTKLDEVGADLADWASKSGSSGKAVGEALAGVNGAALALQLLIQGNFKGAMAEGQTSLEHFGKAADEAKLALADFRTEVGKLGATKSYFAEIEEAGNKLGKTFDDLKATLGGLLPSIFGAGAAAAGTGEQFNVWASIVETTAQPVQRFLTVLEMGASNIRRVGDAFNDSRGPIAGFGDLFSELGTTVSTAIEGLRASVVNGITEAAAGADAQLNAMVDGVGTALTGMVSAATSAMGEFAGTVLGELGSLIGSAASQAGAIGSAIVNGLIGGITSRAGAVADAARNMVTSAINAAKAAADAHSPSREFETLGADMTAGLVIGLEDSIPDAEDAAAELGEAVVEAVADAIDSNAPEAEMAAIDLGQSVADALNAGLGSVKVAAVGGDSLKGTVAGAMADLAADIDQINRDTDRKFQEIGDKAGRAINEAIGSASRQIAETIADTSRNIAELQANFERGRAARAARNAITDRQDAVSRARDQNRELEDVQRERDREDRDNARELAEDLAEAKTDAERAEIIARAQEARDDLLRNRAEEDEDRAYRRRREEEDRLFRKEQDAELQAFEDKQEDDALARSIARALEDRDERIKSINDALAEKQKRISEDAAEEQRKLKDAAADRIRTLKEDFIAKLPPLTAQASSIVTTFLSGIDQAIQNTIRLAHEAASAIAGIGSPGSGGGGGGGDSGGGEGSGDGGGGDSGSHMGRDSEGNDYVIDKPYGEMNDDEQDDANRFANSQSFATGGVVPGAVGSPMMAKVHGGETILPTHNPAFKAGNTIIVNLSVSGSVIAERDLVEQMRSALVRNGRRNVDIFGGLA